jgi:membrane protein required for beta-lactamase induction
MTDRNVEGVREAWRREADEACARHCASVAAQVAGSMMTMALLHPDPAESARALGRAITWQMRAAMFPSMTAIAGFQAAHNALMESAHDRDE